MTTTSGDPPALPALLELLNSQDLGNRLRAINKARELPGPEALTLLQRAIHDENARVRYAAISQMGTLSGVDPNLLLPILQRSLREDPEFDVRAAAAAALGDLKQPQALADLLEAYRRETEWLVRFSIIAALGELGNPAAFDTLVEALQDKSELITTAAAAALGDLGDPRAIPYLDPLIDSDDWQLRYRVCIALAKLGTEAARAGLTRLAQDSQEQVAVHARAALGSL
ncbi:HEAT repeat domain-containing protein [Synechococcus sp. R6-5]|uniref:HEAT repeat domain-containing protein n=2 Tax=unclassified Synechococcus TaxID=2626047 RepID=UPI0039C2C6F9